MMPSSPTPSHVSHGPPTWLCELPKKDPWSTPFAESLLCHLDLQSGLSILDVCCGNGIPAFHLAYRVGQQGRVVGVDLNQAQLVRCRAVQGPFFSWLEFCEGDVRSLPADLGKFERITGNLSFMFFRPNRLKALQQLVSHLDLGGQLVLTFPSQGTFDTLWQRVDRELRERRLNEERERFAEYLNERPSAQNVRAWLEICGLEKIVVKEYPLEVSTGPGMEFLYHPLLRGGFLDDVYECFADQELAERFMQGIADDLSEVLPLIAQRCVMSGWLPETDRNDGGK